IVGEVVTAGADAQPQVSWRAGQQTLVLRRHAELLQVLTAPVDPVAIDAEIDLLPGQTLTLPGNGSVTLTLGDAVLPRDVSRFSIRYRRGGESLRLQGRRTRALKKILQESGLPPWQRQRLPLLFADDELVAVAGVGVAEGWSAVC